MKITKYYKCTTFGPYFAHFGKGAISLFRSPRPTTRSPQNLSRLQPPVFLHPILSYFSASIVTIKTGYNLNKY